MGLNKKATCLLCRLILEILSEWYQYITTEYSLFDTYKCLIVQ